MGGFRIDGTGASDHFKKVKSLGVHRCPKCGKDTEFFLELAKFKIDIFYIPTVTLKKRYAVICSKCENGQFVSEAWADELLRDGPHDQIFEGVQPTRIPTQESTVRQTATSGEGTRAMNLSEDNGDPRTFRTGKEKMPDFVKCQYCNVTQLREGDYCMYCGKPLPAAHREEAREERREPPRSVCPACGASVKPGALFCGECGKKL